MLAGSRIGPHRLPIVLSLAALLLVGSAVACASSDDTGAVAPLATATSEPTTALSATSTPTQPAEPIMTMPPSPTATPRAIRTPSSTPTPFPEAGRAAQARFAPATLTIPRIGIDAVVVSVGVTSDGQLEAPSDYSTVGWYAGGPAPGEAARAVFDGHLDSRTGPAVFYRLREVVPGDEIIVRSSQVGSELVFVVRETASFPTAEAPLERVFGPTDHPELVLITCDGTFERSGGGYQERLIVFADLRDNSSS